LKRGPLDVERSQRYLGGRIASRVARNDRGPVPPVLSQSRRACLDGDGEREDEKERAANLVDD